jgi:hypothetical protein
MVRKVLVPVLDNLGERTSIRSPQQVSFGAMQNATRLSSTASILYHLRNTYIFSYERMFFFYLDGPGMVPVRAGSEGPRANER